jgi:hypothetical protein
VTNATAHLASSSVTDKKVLQNLAVWSFWLSSGQAEEARQPVQVALTGHDFLDSLSDNS